MKNKIGAGVTGVCIVVIALLYASPYVGRHIDKALERKDTDTVAEYVDFPALRESIKGHMLLTVQEQMQYPQVRINTFAGVDMLNDLTASLVPPTGVTLMLERGKRTGVARAGVGFATHDGSPRKDFSVDYQSWSKVFVHPKNQPRGFIFKRDGLMGWKLVAVKMN